MSLRSWRRLTLKLPPMIVRCRVCRKGYPATRPACPHCATENAGPRGNARVQMRYWLALLVAFAGVAWYFSALAAVRDSRSARWLIGAGVLWYVVARIVSAAMRWRG